MKHFIKMFHKQCINIISTDNNKYLWPEWKKNDQFQYLILKSSDGWWVWVVCAQKEVADTVKITL